MCCLMFGRCFLGFFTCKKRVWQVFLGLLLVKEEFGMYQRNSACKKGKLHVKRCVMIARVLEHTMKPQKGSLKGQLDDTDTS